MPDNGSNIKLSTTVQPKPAVENEEFGYPIAMPFSFEDYSVPKNQPPNTFVFGDPMVGWFTLPQLAEARRTDGHMRALIRVLTLPIMSTVPDSAWVPGEDGAEQEAEMMNLMFYLP